MGFPLQFWPQAGVVQLKIDLQYHFLTTRKWAEPRLKELRAASPQSLIKWPLILSDSFLIHCPYCSKQLLGRFILSENGSKGFYPISNSIPSSWLTDQYPISSIVVVVLLSYLPPCLVWLEIRTTWVSSRNDWRQFSHSRNHTDCYHVNSGHVKQAKPCKPLRTALSAVKFEEMREYFTFLGLRGGHECSW